MVVNLWDVIDKDIDRFLVCLLSFWLLDYIIIELRKFLDVVFKVRVVCRLLYLIGAVFVVYGFSVFFKSF